MARGKKNLTLDEQLETITYKIENMEDSLKKLEETRKELEEQIRMNKLNELDDIIKASGKSFEEVKELLGIQE